VKLCTWNVNGIRAREAQVREFIDREQPDVICLQEIKAAPDQVPPSLCELEGYSCYWHGGKGYSGVGLHVRTAAFDAAPVFSHPAFDMEHRIVVAALPGVSIASVYVPNGGKDFEAKMKFVESLVRYAADAAGAGTPLVLCGDLNIAREDRDIHPKERKPNQIGARKDERALFAGLLATGLTDVGRALDPENDNLFTWWAPWRNLRQRNIGWRIDYVLASEPLASRATASAVAREFGTSDHAPLSVVFG
jgi:exodeoxyribonuclease-3